MKRWLALIISLTMCAQTTAIDWQNTNGNNQWEDDGNWSGGVQPSATEHAIIKLTGADRAIISQAGEQANIVLVGGNGAAGELDMTGGDLTARLFIVGDGQVGQFDQSAGTLVLSEDLFVGNSSSTSGIWNMSGGTATARKVVTGASNGSTFGTINQSGGTITTVEHFMVGDNGNGTINMIGGTVHAGLADERALIIGLGGSAGSSNTTVGGTAQMFGNDTIVGDNARGTNTLVVEGNGKINGGRHGGAFRIAANNLVNASVVVQDFGEINVGPDPLNGLLAPIVVGNNASATSVNDASLTVRDNGIVRGRLLIIGDSNGAKGKVILEDDGMIDVSEGFVVGASGKINTIAIFEMSGGNLSGANFLVTDGPSQVASATITGGAIQMSGSVLVGANSNLGSGVLTIDASGTVLTASNLSIRNNGDVIHNSGDIILQGGLSISPEAEPGFGIGSYNMTGGSLSLGGDHTATIQGFINSGSLFSTHPSFGSFQISFDGNRTLVSLNVIPEPATFALLGFALLAYTGCMYRGRLRSQGAV